MMAIPVDMSKIVQVPSSTSEVHNLWDTTPHVSRDIFIRFSEKTQIFYITIHNSVNTTVTE